MTFEVGTEQSKNIFSLEMTLSEAPSEVDSIVAIHGSDNETDPASDSDLDEYYPFYFERSDSDDYYVSPHVLNFNLQELYTPPVPEYDIFSIPLETIPSKMIRLYEDYQELCKYDVV